MINFTHIRNTIIKKENLYFLILILVIFYLDRHSKNIIMSNYSDNQFFINDYLNLNLVWNTGIGFGLFSFQANWIYHFIIFIIYIIIIYLFYLTITSKVLQKISLTIIIGGALGNLYDRMFFFAVPDFIDLHYKNFHWFTFNVADIFITVGILLYLTLEFLNKNEN